MVLLLRNLGGYTLQELAQAAEMEPRTVRSWIQEGLVPGPLSKGRNAVYPPESLSRLLAAKRLRDEKRMTMGEVRHFLAAASMDEIDSIARGDTSAMTASEASYSDDVAFSEDTDTAADYVSRVQDHYGARSVSRSEGLSMSSEPYPDASEDDMARYEAILQRSGKVVDREDLSRLVSEANSMFGMDAIQNKARGEAWTKVPINPDVNLEVRGQLDDRSRRRYEHLADILREWLARGIGKA